jgi:hypothetical protein
MKRARSVLHRNGLRRGERGAPVADQVVGVKMNLLLSEAQDAFFLSIPVIGGGLPKERAHPGDKIFAVAAVVIGQELFDQDAI